MRNMKNTPKLTEITELKISALQELLDKGFSYAQVAKITNHTNSYIYNLRKKLILRDGLVADEYVNLALKVLSIAMKQYTKNPNYRNATPALTSAKEVLQRRYPTVNQTLSLSVSISPVDLAKYLNKSALPNP